MKQGFSSSQMLGLRTRPQGAAWYAAIHRPKVDQIFLVDGASSLYGSIVGEVPVVSIASGTSLAKAGMTGVVYDVDGDVLGELRIRRDWTGGKLAVAEAGSGLIRWKEATYIYALDQYRPWIKHPRYDVGASQWRMDFDIPYDGQLNDWGPYPNLGPPIVALPTSWVMGSGEELEPVWVLRFWHDSKSLQNILTGASWTFPDGQTVTSWTGTGSGAYITMTFNGASPGGSYFSLAVSDNNGASWLGRRLIFTARDISQFPKVLVSDITGGIEQGGYQARLLASFGNTGGLSLSSHPYLDNSEIVLFENAHYGASNFSLGGNYANRESTIFRGWIKGYDLRVGPFSSDMSITAETVGGIIGESDSYDIFLANYQAGGSDWTEMQSLCMDGVAQFALKWRSTLADICDWYPMGGLGITENIFYQDLPRAPFFDQLRQNYGEKGVLGYFASDMQGNLHAFQDVNISGGSELVPQTTLDSSDMRDDIIISAVPRDTNAQVSLYAVTSDIPYGAESPAHVRGYFGGERMFERGMLVDGQDRLITWAGNYRAKVNSKFPRVSLPIANNMRIDPVPQSVVNLSMAASNNARGITWTNKGFLTKEINVTYDATAGYPLWDLALEEVVDGIGGSSITFPTVDDIVPIPTDPPPPGNIIIPIIPPGVDEFGTGFGTCYVLLDDTLYRTRALSASSPTWVDITPGGVSGLNDFILDPWNPAQIGYLLGTDGVYKSTDLDAVSPTFTQVLSSAGIQSLVGAPTTVGSFYKIIGSINTQDWFAFAATYPRSGGGAVNGGFVLIYTTNGGSSWSYSTISSVLFRDYGHGGGLDIVPHIVSGAKVLYATTDGGGAAGANNFFLYKSTDNGISWSQIAAQPVSGSIRGGILCHCPYNDNEAGNKVYWAEDVDNSVNTVYFTENTTTSAIAPVTTDALVLKRWNTESYTLDRQKMYHWHSTALYTSDDAGANWSAVSYSGLPTTNFKALATGGFPNNSSQFYLLCTSGVGSNVGVYVSTNRGVSWTNKTGNISHVWALSDTRRAVVVPLWTE